MTTYLWVALALTLCLGIAMYVFYVAGPQPVAVVVTQPEGEVILYKIQIDDAIAFDTATVPARLEYRCYDLTFMVIPRDSPNDSVVAALQSRQTDWQERGAGVRGGYRHRVGLTSYSVGAMDEVEVEELRVEMLDAEMQNR